jgi:predicted ester cyclase
MTSGLTNKHLIQDLIQQVWRDGRLDELPRFWTVDCVNHADASAENSGSDAIRRYHEGFGIWFGDLDDIKIEVLQQVAEADRVVTQMLLRATHKATGRKVSLATIRIDRIVQGKIAEHWSIADMADFAQQLA